LEDMFAALVSDLPPIQNVERRTEVIKGLDNNLVFYQFKQLMGAAIRWFL